MRINESYNGFEIVADFYKGKFQGRAHGERKFDAVGPDTESVVAALRSQIDDWRRDRVAILAAERRERHRAFLKARGILYQGVREASMPRSRRVTHCYACKTHLDNAINVQCVACNWILCDCGACGCGWTGHY
jgi:hypothetical protein